MARNFSATEPLRGRERIYYALGYAGFYLLSLMPFRLLYIISDLIFHILYHSIKYRRNIVRKNLKECFPEKSEEELQSIERGFYHWFCDYIVETLKMFTLSKSSAKKHITFEGMEHVYEALDEGHNVALYIAHYCTWEWITAISLHLPEGVLVGQVYHILENKVMDRLVYRLRTRMGTQNITKHEILRTTVKTMRDGRQLVIGFISDSAPEIFNVHHWLPFLNHETAVITGSETLAKRCNYACVYLKMTRKKRGYYNVKVIPMVKESSTMPDFEITDMYFKLLEETIREAPQYWLWTHNRWKRSRAVVEAFQAQQKRN